MDLLVKTEITKSFKNAESYIAWMNPAHVWWVRLFDKDGNEIKEFFFNNDLPEVETTWIWEHINNLKWKEGE